MLNVSMTIQSLKREISNARTFLDEFVVRNGHSLLDHTIARFIWGAIATSDAILTLVKEKKFNGSAPLVRNLLETTFTLNYVYNCKNPDKIAARIFVWEIIHEEKAEKGKPNIFKYEKEPLGFVASVPYKVICKELKAIGEDTNNIEEAFLEATTSKRVHWHWSGRGPGALIKQYKAKTELLEIDLMMSYHYKHLWSSFSSEIHASASWANPYISTSLIEEFKLIDPMAEDQTRAAALAGLSGAFMKTIIAEAKEFCGKNAF